MKQYIKFNVLLIYVFLWFLNADSDKDTVASSLEKNTSKYSLILLLNINKNRYLVVSGK